MTPSPGLIEVWLPVTGYGGAYEVSDRGRIRSLRSGRPRLMSPYPDKDGYARICLLAGRKRKTEKLHRLVCRTFNGPGSELHREVAHLDGDRGNASAANLKWVSHVENHSHRRAHGTDPAGERHPRAKLTWAAVRSIRASRMRYASLAAEYGVSWHTISDVKRGRRWLDGVSRESRISVETYWSTP